MSKVAIFFKHAIFIRLTDHTHSPILLQPSIQFETKLCPIKYSIKLKHEFNIWMANENGNESSLFHLKLIGAGSLFYKRQNYHFNILDNFTHSKTRNWLSPFQVILLANGKRPTTISRRRQQKWMADWGRMR
jgi:hypothetical protein